VKPEDGKPCSLKQAVPYAAPPVTVRLIAASSPTLITTDDGLVDRFTWELESPTRNSAPCVRLEWIRPAKQILSRMRRAVEGMDLTVDSNSNADNLWFRTRRINDQSTPTEMCIIHELSWIGDFSRLNTRGSGLNTSCFELFDTRSKMQRLEPTLDECAREVMDVVPPTMRAIREQLRKQRTEFLSVPQFRTLLFINRNRNASLSQVADAIGLTLPSMSALVDGLVKRNFVSRRTEQDDRRRINLTLTQRGESTLESARKATQQYLKDRLSNLSEQERTVVIKGLEVLRRIFIQEVS